MRANAHKLSMHLIENQTTMSDTKESITHAVVVPYPDKTTGSEAAASVRKQANNWSDDKRAKLFEQGMQIIYGGSGPATAKVRS